MYPVISHEFESLDGAELRYTCTQYTARILRIVEHKTCMFRSESCPPSASAYTKHSKFEKAGRDSDEKPEETQNVPGMAATPTAARQPWLQRLRVRRN